MRRHRGAGPAALRARRGAVAALLALGAAWALPAAAQDYPVRPVRIVVPYAPGGPVDQLARGLAERLGQRLGQPFVVDNKPGGNTLVGASLVAKAPADGYTLFMASSASLAVNPLVYPKLPYDPDKDFDPISMVASAPLVMVVGKDVPARNLKELRQYIATRAGSFAYASNGTGNPLHLACALFGSMADLDLLHVPYNGTAPALASVLAGDTQMACDIVLSSLPQIRAGRLRPIGIIGPKRVPVLPEVPTLAEEGLLGVDASVWFALVAPKGTPTPALQRLGSATGAALQDPAMRERFQAMAMELQAGTPADVTAKVGQERRKWSQVVQRYAIKID